MMERICIDDIAVARPLHQFVEQEVLPGLPVAGETFWRVFATLVRDLGPRNEALLSQRDEYQRQIDAWHREHRGEPPAAQEEFLRRIGYLVPEGEDFVIDTAAVDPEIAALAGPQLVVPVDNARYALNAANARWGSLYDALYGTDAIAGPPPGRSAAYDEKRGADVIRFGKAFLDRHFPLDAGSHEEAVAYAIVDANLRIALRTGRDAGLKDSAAFVGYQGAVDSPASILLVHHGLHVDVRIDRSRGGLADAAGITDILLEAALTTIQDCEDSVAAVDVDDKIVCYRNWLGLMRGTLTATFSKDGREQVRALADDRRYLDPRGDAFTLKARSLLLVRNVGHFIPSDAVQWQGRAIPEAFIDAAVTALIALHDLARPAEARNSRTGSVYIVKPKLHGPEEAAFANELFDRVEDLLGLRRHTLKLGLMDEERRTSVNLKECIRAVRHRLVFINTGFLDRTGDEIHTAMEAGPVVRKAELKKAGWLDAYERRNVAIGVRCGLSGRAQIGKGMWAMPDLMAGMLADKIAHPRAGASTAWVPSPTAATLHALHYHEVDVFGARETVASKVMAPLETLLVPPLAGARPAPADLAAELDSNAQSILGYVVRWVDLGIGCSKVPDGNDVALMEDRATLRISSQHMANWLHHGWCTSEQVEAALRRMARVVDRQNAAEPGYRRMADDFEGSLAFQAARDLVLHGRDQPNGYVETILYACRREVKAARR